MPMYCEDCKTNLPADVTAGEPCPQCGGSRVSAVVDVQVVDTVTTVDHISIQIGYSDDARWEQRWDSTTRLLARLRQMYDSGKSMNNVDMVAVIHSYVIECWHMWDSLLHDAQSGVSKTELNAFEKNHEPIQIIRGFAHTYKHTERAGKRGYVARVSEFHAEPSGCRVEVMYHKVAQALPKWSIDARVLADQAYAAWQEFIASKGLVEQPNIQRILRGEE